MGCLAFNLARRPPVKSMAMKRSIRSTRRVLAAVALAGIAGLFWMSTDSSAQVQVSPATQPSEAEMRGQVDIFRKMVEDRLKTQLELTDQEFEVLNPRIQQINKMLMGSDNQMVAMTFMARSAAAAAQTQPAAAGQNRPAQTGPRPVNPAMSAMTYIFGDFTKLQAYQRAEALQEALERPDASIETLKTRIRELREARKVAKDELKKTREELRGLCTARQEAMLVLLGILD